MEKELLIIGDERTFLSEKDLKKLTPYFTINFINKNSLSTSKLWFSKNKKVVLIDPDYIDWKFPNAIWENVENLQAVCLATTTDSYIDTALLKRKNIPVYTITNYATQSVAEYLIMLMFCVAKKLPMQLKNQNKQDFTDDFLQYEIGNKKIGIIGLGQIGNRVCELCENLCDKIVYWDRKPKDVKYERVALDEIFKTCDVIFLTLAINSETKQLIKEPMLKNMKNTAILISGTGFELFDEKIVLNMVKTGQIYGFGAEIPNMPLEKYEGNVMVTSEYAWFTSEASEKRRKIMIDNILKNK